MAILKFIKRPHYGKNGTTIFGQGVATIIGENNYEWFRLERRILYGKFWYFKQAILTKFQIQYPHIAVWFGILNKTDTTMGLPAKRVYERHQDFAVYNLNHEGWFQLLFTLAFFVVIYWNWWILAYHYDIRG